MRVTNFCGLFVIGTITAGACGGESALSPTLPGTLQAGDSGNGEGGDEGGSGPVRPPRGGTGAVGSGGDLGEGGEGAGPNGGSGARGGTPTSGGAEPAGGTGGGPSATGGIGAGGSPVSGGVPSTGGVPVTGGVPSTGGFGGEGGAPDDCTLRPYSGPGYCELQSVCDGETQYTTCTDQGDGSSWCSCAHSSAGFANFEIEGVSAPAACQVAHDLCADPDGGEECESPTGSRSTTFCELQQQCRQQLDDDVTAVRQRYAYCSQNVGRMSCSCDQLTLDIEGVDGTKSCDVALHACADPDLVFDGPVECVPELQSSGPGYCESQQRCSRTAEYEGTVLSMTTGYQYAYCSRGPGGSASCSCGNDRGELRLDLDAPIEAQTCEDLAQACASEEVVNLEGPITCERNYQSAAGTSCNAQVSCSQAGTFGDRPVRAYGSLYTYCNQVGGLWSCSCQSNLESTSLEVEATDAWDACTQATETCPDLIEVPIGEGTGGFPLPPFPI